MRSLHLVWATRLALKQGSGQSGAAGSQQSATASAGRRSAERNEAAHIRKSILVHPRLSVFHLWPVIFVSLPAQISQKSWPQINADERDYGETGMVTVLLLRPARSILNGIDAPGCVFTGTLAFT